MWGPENALLTSHEFSIHFEERERKEGKLFATFFRWMALSNFLTVASLGLAEVPTVHDPLPVPSFQKKNKTRLSNNKKVRGVGISYSLDKNIINIYT